ncbi:MAG: M23 family metallopeptidase [Rikenellaceae bacterium]|nr:M23 family metallopeptidase [Rikenellaceae bacterium]
MEFGKGLKYLIRNLREKHRLSLRNQHDDSEVWYMFISPLNIVSVIVAVVLVLFVIILSTVAYTSILDLVPGYPGSRSRAMLVENIMRLDSMERELSNMRVYSDNIALVMAGKTPVMRTLPEADTFSPELTDKTAVPRTAEDSVLRSQMEGEGEYGLNRASSVKKLRESFELAAPVSGIVIEKFDPRSGQYGVGITTTAEQPVVAVAAGTVILSMWSPDEGYVMQVQHPDNIVSVYKHVEQVIRQVGERVRVGEILGYTASEADRGVMVFELWNNGTAVDPEGYILF